MSSDPRAAPSEAAWDAVHEALPARWRVGPVTFDPGIVRSDGQLGAFSVTARAPHPGRGKLPMTVSGTGETADGALSALDDQLRGVPKPHGSQLEHLRGRLRLAYVEGAENWTREHLGRVMTAGELARVLRRYEGR